jgi:hypothetical protein
VGGHVLVDIGEVGLVNQFNHKHGTPKYDNVRSRLRRRSAQ